MKKFLSIGLIGLICLMGLISPVAAFAQESSGGVLGAIFGRFSFLDAITFFLAEMGNVVLSIAGKILDMAGAILNISIEKSIGEVSALLTQVPIVDVGWTVFRDIANLVFIFVLLWVGIRFILGLAGGDGKRTLFMVILMALLINFSLFITKAIVDAGNIPALHFYNAMRPNLVDPATCKPPKDPNTCPPILDGNGQPVKAGLSDIYMEGLRLQTFMGSGSTAQDMLASAGGFANQFTKIVIATVFGTIFFLVTAFVFLAAAFFFVTRAVVLMLLMLLSPLAFAAHAIPGLQGKASEWWNHLFKQTFFAPLYMALAYAVARAIQSGGFGTLLNITGNQQSFAALMEAPASQNIGIIINYIFLIAIMAYTLTIAKWGGAVGADMVIGWGKQLQGLGMGMLKGGAMGALGAAGSMLRKRVAEPIRGAAGAIGERIQTSQGAGARILRALPGITGAAAASGALARSDIDIAEKRISAQNLSDDALKNIATKVTSTEVERAAIVRILAGRNNLRPQGNFDSTTVQNAVQTITSRNASARDVLNLTWQHAATLPDRVNAVAGFTHPTDPRQNIPRLTTAAIQNIAENYFDDSAAVGYNPATNQALRTAMYQNFHGGHAQEITNRGGNVYNRFFTNLGQDLMRSGFTTAGVATNSITNLTNWLESPTVNNRALSAWARSQAGQNVLHSFGFV